MGYTGLLSGLWLIFLLISPALKAHAAETAGTVSNKPFLIAMYPGANELQSQLITRIYHELFTRLGITVNVQPFPMKRASVQADDGKIDGEAIRIRNYSQMHPNLRLIDFPVVQVVFVAYARRSHQIRLEDGWDSLIDSDYMVGYRRGIVYSEQILKKHINPERLNESKSAEQGLLKLIHGRIDLFVYPLGHFVSHQDLQESTEVVSVLETVPLYLYVHKRHEALIPDIEQSLIDMRAEGRMMELCTQVYQQEADKHCINDGIYSSLLW
ncbi:substrate-binding periplasmic protein [Vibrio quintilis]|uniref:Uncharacterized protein n=1 Tax=Vibrio quintilis TaxID=1117707 RepID=A0A1M7YSW4_9VIBR|nr:transporter substrate-binding domain-containing protein [Vibrio quintilis]SHO55713.1 hypothetical protein VQ7734_01459 [Vibrio quintilis]